ncbi:MAG: alpha-1,6-mannosyltransferase [Cirrosporium novae-zelandiae]|nr:MAG: alpha-1,6-mannosyltransferase [Cirrosporium novae-zelandiae]
MSLSRSPSPQRAGGWSTPGLSPPFENMSGSSTPRKGYGDLYANGSGSHTVTWASAKAKSDAVNGYPSFSTRNNGWFYRHARQLSSSLPRFNMNYGKDYRELEKINRGRWHPSNSSKLSRIRTCTGGILRRMKLRFLLILALMVGIILFYVTPLHHVYQRSSTFGGGGNKFVLVLGANPGGGVMDWKGPREWAIERDSIKNKRKYVKRWGYDLEIVDMMTKKRYAHEWRESWEKVDAVRNAMRKYPKAEWFWWLDLNTFIMEHSYSLQRHIFDHLNDNVYRDIDIYNPLHIQPSLNDTYLDPVSQSPLGDNTTNSLNLLVSQDCGGFNLGSFFVKRSEWSDKLLDVWWDPVAYEQRHMEWEHKEQDALEYIYSSQPWIRAHTGFLPQRKINSFPPGACGDNGDDSRIHYNESDRDFLVNMAGCEWGRDCWAEMYKYRELSNYLNRTPWEKFKDGISDAWKSMTQQKPKEEEKKG